MTRLASADPIRPFSAGMDSNGDFMPLRVNSDSRVLASVPESDELHRKVTQLVWMLASSQERHFMAALYRNPRDRSAMLQYADWLDEQCRVVEADHWRNEARGAS